MKPKTTTKCAAARFWRLHLIAAMLLLTFVSTAFAVSGKGKHGPKAAPDIDSFPQAQKRRIDSTAESPFVSALPRRLLAHPKGPALAVFLAFTFIPFLRSIWLSFNITDQTGNAARFNGLAYYARILNVDGRNSDERCENCECQQERQADSAQWDLSNVGHRGDSQ